MTQLEGSGSVTKCDGRQLFEHEGDIVDGGVRTERPGGSCALEQALIELLRVCSLEIEVLGRLEGARQPQCQCATVRVHRTAHEDGKCLPRIALIVQRRFHRRDVARQTIGTETAQEVLLACVPAVQRADADSGSLSHRRNRRLGICDEDLARRFQDALIVASCLRSTAAEGNGRVGHDLQYRGTYHSVLLYWGEQIIPFP